MKNLFLPNADSPVIGWLGMIGLILLLALAMGAVVIWVKVVRGNKVKRKRKKKHHRGHNPTLSQTGGLPPRRDPNQPPPGP